MPGDNSSFIRSKILKHGDELELLFNTDILLMRRLLADGEKLYRAANWTSRIGMNIGSRMVGWRYFIGTRCTSVT
jgi:hypothetical protein